MTDDASSYDVVVIGGALSGAATATLLLRQNPGIRLLIVEKSAAAPAPGGRGDGGSQRLLHGPRPRVDPVSERIPPGEAGPAFLVCERRGPKLSERRANSGGRIRSACRPINSIASTFDEEVLRRACVAGAELLRPATVSRSASLSPGGEQTVIAQKWRTD